MRCFSVSRSWPRSLPDGWEPSFRHCQLECGYRKTEGLRPRTNASGRSLTRKCQSSFSICECAAVKCLQSRCESTDFSLPLSVYLGERHFKEEKLIGTLSRFTLELSTLTVNHSIVITSPAKEKYCIRIKFFSEIFEVILLLTHWGLPKFSLLRNSSTRHVQEKLAAE